MATPYNPPYQDPPLPQQQPTQEDLAAFTEPVAEMDMSQLPTPVAATRPAKGLSFDWSVLNAQTQEEYDAKPPALQHLIHEIKNTQGLQPTPEWAANRIIEIQRAIDEQNSPKAQAQTQAAKLSAEKTQLDIQKTKTESSAASAQKLQDAQKTYQSASNMVWLLDNLRGGARDKVTANSEKWRSRVGSIDGRWPSLLSSEETLGWNADFNSLKGMINLSEAKENRGQGNFTEGERTLMAQAASLGLEQARDEEGFKAAFERMYDLALTTQERERKKLLGEPAASQGTPQPAPQPAPLPQFQSREQVMQAVNAGQITREQGAQALRAQFGNQFR